MRSALLMTLAALGGAGCCNFPQANFGPLNPCSLNRFSDLQVRARIKSAGPVTSRTISAFPSTPSCWTPLDLVVSEVRKGALRAGDVVTAFVATEVSADFAIAGQQVPYTSDAPIAEPAWFFLRAVNEGAWLGLDSLGVPDGTGRVHFVGGDFESSEALAAAADASAAECPFVPGPLQ